MRSRCSEGNRVDCARYIEYTRAADKFDLDRGEGRIDARMDHQAGERRDPGERIVGECLAGDVDVSLAAQT